MFDSTLSNKEIQKFHQQEVGPTFQTGEWRRFVSRRLVGKCEIGQTEAGAVVLVEIACWLDQRDKENQHCALVS